MMRDNTVMITLSYLVSRVRIPPRIDSARAPAMKYVSSSPEGMGKPIGGSAG
jgi:hypothetical protein